MNYRNLLIKYIQHVGACEGVSYLSPSWFNEPHFSKEEWEELQRLDAESDKPVIEEVSHDPYTQEKCPHCYMPVFSIARDGFSTRFCIRQHKWLPSEGLLTKNNDF